MVTITANQLKTEGVSSIARALAESDEVVITVRGKPRYVAISIEEYDRLREKEIEAAWFRARAEYEAGQFVAETADEHVARIRSELKDAL